MLCKEIVNIVVILDISFSFITNGFFKIEATLMEYPKRTNKSNNLLCHYIRRVIVKNQSAFHIHFKFVSRCKDTHFSQIDKILFKDSPGKYG